MYSVAGGKLDVPAITNCKVTKGGSDVITNPTSAELTDDLKPTMNIVVKGGTRNGLSKASGYKITGKVGTTDRNFISMKCTDDGTNAKFVKM
jgi:cell division protein FtsI/penicillin-binding protein 2